MSFSEISAFIAIVAAINGLFAGAEIKLRTPYKESLARWLRGQARPDESWATTFRALFDHVFAVRTFTGPKGTCYWLPSIGRSFVGSMSLVLVLYMVYASLLPADMTISLRYGLVDDPRNAYLGIPYDWVILRGEQVVVAQSIAVAFVLPLFLNLIPDYFSLAQTRFVLERAAGANRWPVRAAWVALDAALTITVALLAYVFINAAFYSIFYASREVGFVEYSQRFFHWFPGTLAVFRDPIDNEDAAFIYSTFLTSAWLWLYLSGSIRISQSHRGRSRKVV